MKALNLRSAARISSSIRMRLAIHHAVHAMRHLAEVSPGTYGPYGSHRLVLTGPDHAVMPRLVLPSGESVPQANYNGGEGSS